MAAAHDRAHKGGPLSVRHVVAVDNKVRFDLCTENALHKIAVRAVAAFVPGFGAVHFHDCHRQTVEIPFQRFIALAGKYGHIIQVDAPDGGIVIRLCRVFKAQVVTFPMFGENALKGHRFPVIVALDFGAADFTEKIDLLLFLHAFADRVDSKADGHFGQLCQDDLRLVFFEMLHKAHVELEQVKADLLQNVQ